jgi:hypothetical protein
MKYMLLIHQGTTPLPGSDAWDALSEEQKGAVFGAYKALSETPGVSPGQQLAPPETATTVRVQDGKTLTTDGPFVELKEAVGGYLHYLHSTRAELLRRLGRTDEARDAYDRALALVQDDAERRLLERRLAELGIA